MGKVKNRFNNIDSKEWLPFQKSWFSYSGSEDLYRSNIRFFTQANDEHPKPHIFFDGQEHSLFMDVAEEEGRALAKDDKEGLQFALIDLRKRYQSTEDYKRDKKDQMARCYRLFRSLSHRKFLCVLIDRSTKDDFYPIAWDLSQSIGNYYSLKDEKVACVEGAEKLSGPDHFYCLYFRKDEKSIKRKALRVLPFKGLNEPTLNDSWAVIRPPRRKKDEILHPAKYPERLIKMFIASFSEEGGNVFDPMSGTGSTQMAALETGRHAYGCELSAFFREIAHSRCTEAAGLELDFRIENTDARNALKQQFPKIDYVITSPPYWDMLNMKGAENQAARKSKGLLLNYSDDNNDLGNIEDYQAFLDELIGVYQPIKRLLKKGGYFTIIVKNIKKKGSNYPFAWDLSVRMCKEGWKLLPEFHWCQDDINIAPYGYGNTWVSNTFHQYCLTFKNV